MTWKRQTLLANFTLQLVEESRNGVKKALDTGFLLF